MSQLPQMHIIETQIQAGQTLFISIPSPFAKNEVIRTCVELLQEPNDQLYAEMWGALPEIPGLPEHRVKVATGYIPFPRKNFATYHSFLDAMVKAVVESQFCKDGTKTLLDLYSDAAENNRHENG